MMRPDVVVLPETQIDGCLRLTFRCQPFGVQDVPAQRPVEAFVVAILPRAAGGYLYRLDANLHQLCSAVVDQKQYPG
jgi:hypothetical protein